jgi:competence transcription factor ComK
MDNVQRNKIQKKFLPFIFPIKSEVSLDQIWNMCHLIENATQYVDIFITFKIVVLMYMKLSLDSANKDVYVLTCQHIINN